MRTRPGTAARARCRSGTESRGVAVLVDGLSPLALGRNGKLRGVGKVAGRMRKPPFYEPNFLAHAGSAVFKSGDVPAFFGFTQLLNG